MLRLNMYALSLVWVAVPASAAVKRHASLLSRILFLLRDVRPYEACSVPKQLLLVEKLFEEREPPTHEGKPTHETASEKGKRPKRGKP